MHIGFLTNEYPPLPSGGIGTSIRNLARALVTQGHRVTVLGWGQPTEFNDRGVTVRFFSDTKVKKMGWLVNRWRMQQEINRLVSNEQLEIVEAPDWCGLSAGMSLDCPLLIKCNGSATYFAHIMNDSVRPAVRLAERLALQQADAIVAVSRYTAELTRDLFRLARNIGSIPNGIDFSQFQTEEVEEAT